jgi:transcription-repair coupling factor (superfamily II helicase)
MALTGARDMSLLETPPANRYAVETVVCGFDERLIRDAIDRELAREGQVYFLHNRIDTIFRTAERIRGLCPGAKVEIGHGQMEEHDLEDVMRRYVAGEVDVLVSTTIIESGLDIPNANTILIDRADRFGLADLYQLRGRVGRGSHKAYAYLFLPRDFMSTGEARRRIEAITQYSSLGAGFQIAMRDLEIRGAGSILGVAQSGHVTAIGFDLYCQLLEQAVAKLKGKTLPRRPEVSLQLDFVDRDEIPAAAAPAPKTGKSSPTLQAWLPVSYIADTRLRIEAFRRLAGVCTPEQLKQLRAEWRDRYGRIPPAADHLLILTGIKLLASEKGVSTLETKGDRLILTRAAEPIQLAGRFPRLTSRDADSKVREIADLLRQL